MQNRILIGLAVAALGIGAVVLWISHKGALPLSSAADPAPSSQIVPAKVESVAEAVAFLKTCDRVHADPARAIQACQVLTKANDQAAIMALLTYIDLHIASASAPMPPGSALNTTQPDAVKIIRDEYPAFMALLGIGNPATEAAAGMLAGDETSRPLLRAYLLEQLLLNVRGREEAIALVRQQHGEGSTASSTPNLRIEKAVEDLKYMAIDSYRPD